MFDNGLDFGAVFRHPVFLATFVVGFPAWIIAFAGQCAVEANKNKAVSRIEEDLGTSISYSTGAAAGALWFAIWVQLFITIFLFLSCAADTLAVHRFQFSVFIAIALVFAVQGVNSFIYSKGWGAGLATGVGWLLCAMVDIVWLLYLTSEDGSFLYYTFNSGGTGGISGWGGNGRRSVHGGNHGDMGVYGSEVSGLRQGAADRGMNSHDMASSQNGYGMAAYGSGSLDPPRAPAPVTMPASTSRDDFSAASPSVADTTPAAAAPKQRAKANYGYTASPDDPNEVSFTKGEILEVLDTTGKWFQVRTAAGQTGIAPSNYLTLL